jgi:NTE family protein
MKGVLVGVLVAVLSGCAAMKSPVADSQRPDAPVASANASTPAAPVAPQPAPVPEIVVPPPRIALVLGGGAARGFAHVGVIKVLEAQGLAPDIVVGTSAGSVVGALYASGLSGYELQRRAMELDERSVSDWALPNRGFLKGESLQGYVNEAVKGKTIEQMPRALGVVATDLRSGQQTVFRLGNTGMAVRASSSVPGVFQPVTISGREYVDGGLTSPVPVQAARDMGADIVVAVDIAKNPERAKVRDTIDVLLQTFLIMGRAIAAQELRTADVVVLPATDELATADFQSRHLAVLEGEKAALQAIPALRQKIEDRARRIRKEAQASSR